MSTVFFSVSMSLDGYIALSPVLFGAGIRLFDNVDADRIALEQRGVEPSPCTTHLRYTVHRR